MARTTRQVGLALKRVQALHHRTIDAALQQVGLTLVQWDALRHLADHPGATLHELAVLTFQSDQAFGTLAQRLESRDLVRREAGPGRAVHLAMTPTGRRLLGRGSAVVDEALGATLGALSERQLDQLGSTLDRLLGV